MELIKTDGTAERQLFQTLRSRSREVDRKVTAAVSEILEAVRERGDAAVVGGRSCSARMWGVRQIHISNCRPVRLRTDNSECGHVNRIR